MLKLGFPRKHETSVFPEKGEGERKGKKLVSFCSAGFPPRAAGKGSQCLDLPLDAARVPGFTGAERGAGSGAGLGSGRCRPLPPLVFEIVFGPKRTFPRAWQTVPWPLC